MKTKKKLLILLFIIFVCVAGFLYFNPQKNSREAVGADFSWDCVKAERSVTFRIMPHCDIENLIVQVSFRDNNLDTLETKIVTVGDVTQGNEVVFVHTLVDNAFTAGKIIHGCHLSLHSGTVYLE